MKKEKKKITKLDAYELFCKFNDEDLLLFLKTKNDVRFKTNVTRKEINKVIHRLEEITPKRYTLFYPENKKVIISTILFVMESGLTGFDE